MPTTLLTATNILIAVGIGVVNGVVLFLVLRKRKPAEEKEPEPWEVLFNSITDHFEQWEFKDRSKETNDHKIFWQFNNKETGIAMFVTWFPRYEGGYYENEIGFFKDSAVRLRLSKSQQYRLFDACNYALAQKLQRKLAPQEVDYKDGYFYCPYCGQKVDARVVQEEEEREEETRGIQGPGQGETHP